MTCNVLPHGALTPFLITSTYCTVGVRFAPTAYTFWNQYWSNCATHQPQTSYYIRMVFVCIHGNYTLCTSSCLTCSCSTVAYYVRCVTNQPTVAVLDAHIRTFQYADMCPIWADHACTSYLLYSNCVKAGGERSSHTDTHTHTYDPYMSKRSLWYLLIQ